MFLIIKIIQILNHSPPSSSYFYDVLFNGWHAQVGQYLLKSQKGLDIECWIPSHHIRKKMVIDRGHITYKACPSFHPLSGCDLSSSMIRELKNVTRKEDTIIHFHGDRDILTYTISTLFRKQPMIIQHHGSSDRTEFKYLDLPSIEQRAFRDVDYFFVLTKAKKRYLEDQVGIESKKILIQTIGVDFGLFRPLDKNRCRNKLGLPINGKIMLFVGRFERFPRGADIVIKAFKSLKKKFDVSLVMIGGSPEDSLYSFAKKEATYVSERVAHNIMPLYYNASDVFTWFCSKKANYYGGIGISPVEAFGCETPVVSTTLRNVPNGYRKKLGEIPNSPKDLETCVKKVIENNSEYKCREIARKYYDWKGIIRRTTQIYKKLCDLYF
jgi:glycosyltransferase involved in cell wall biosynthesis